METATLNTANQMSKDTSNTVSLSLIQSQLKHHFGTIQKEIKVYQDANQNEAPPANQNEAPVADDPEVAKDIIEQAKASQLLTSDDIKSHMMRKFRQLSTEKQTLDLIEKTVGTPTSELLTFIESHLSQASNETSDEILQLPTKLRQVINNRLDQFCQIGQSELAIDKKNILSYGKITEYWPFVKDIMHSYYETSNAKVSYYPVEFTAVTSVPFELDILSNLNSVGQNRYHVIIQVSSRNQIIICHLPETGYIAQVFIDKVSVAICEYDLHLKKSGSYFHYTDGHLRLVNQYQSGLLEGHSIYLINTQVGLVVPFQKNQIHGMMKTVDSVGKTVYQELFWQNQSLVPIFA